MVTKLFAPDYPRTEEGYIKFPRDVELRRSLFDPEAMTHPAKANLYLLKAILELVTKPGDKLLDPMSGTGSLMIATLDPYYCPVWLIEDSPVFHYVQGLSRQRFMDMGIAESYITLLQGPCQEYLPLTGFFDHIIFSPPYANVLQQQAGEQTGFNKGAMSGVTGGKDTSTDDYLGASSKNLARMKPFFFNQEMVRIYGMLFESLRVGGTMTVVIQDVMKGGKRDELSNWVMRTCIRTGFELFEWFKRYSSGGRGKSVMRVKGFDVVDDEDVIILKRP